MSDRFFRRLAGWSLAVIGGLSFAGVVFGDGRLALGLTAGGLWNMANLFCLGRLLTGWLGPQRSTRRANASASAAFMESVKYQAASFPTCMPSSVRRGSQLTLWPWC